MSDTLLLAFITAALVTALAAPIVRIVSERFGFTDNPGNDSLKVHRQPMSNLGGIAVWCGFVAALAALSMPFPAVLPIIGFFSLALLFGMIDDIWWQKRSTANITVKLFLQFVLASAVAIIVGDQTHQLLSGLAAGLLSVIVINAINMLDGLDGLLSGVITVSAIGFFIVFFLRGDFIGSVFSIILLGCAMGFLTANFPPATLFLGDSGSYLIGAIVSFLIFGNLFADGSGKSNLLGALLLLGMPLFNLFFVILRRVFAGQSPLIGDRLHVYDLINKKTGSVKQTLAINAFVHAIFVAAGVFLLS